MDPCGPKTRKINVAGLYNDSRNDMPYDITADIYSIPASKTTYPSPGQAPPLPRKQRPLDGGESTEGPADGGAEGEEPISKKIEDFSEVVSIVGLRYAFVRGSSKVKRLVWLTLVLFGAGFMIYQIHDRVVTYLAWPTTVDLRIKYNATLRFPSVTVCNENRMSQSAASKLGITDVLHEILPPFPEMKNFVPNYTTFNPSDFGEDWYSLYADLGQPYTEAVDTCFYAKRECNRSEAFDVTPTNMGFCFTFNPKRINYVAARPGATYGLIMGLFVNQADYLISNSQSAGFRVLLHEPNELPLMKQWGFKVTPGYDTLVAMTLSNLTMLPSPYSDCIDTRGYVYSDCIAVCESKYIAHVCECRLPESDGDLRVCNPEEEDVCVANASDTFVLSGLANGCDCPRQCHQRTYQYTISQAEIGSYFVDLLLATKFGFLTADYVRRNVAILEIFYSELSYEDIRTLASYDVLSLLCDIGGALGLILGSTVLTLFEIVDFTVSVGWGAYRKRRA